MEWIEKNRLVTVILVLAGAVIIGVAISSNREPVMDSSTPPPKAEVTQQPKEPEFDVVAFYEKVQNGMTKEQVVELAGRQPVHCTEGDVSGYGNHATCSWSASSVGPSATIQFRNNLVENKTKTDF